MSQVTNNCLLRFADAIAVGGQDGGIKTLAFGEREPIEERIEKFELFLKETPSALGSMPKTDPKEKDYKLKGIEGIAQEPMTLESRLYTVALACMQEMAGGLDAAISKKELTFLDFRAKVKKSTGSSITAG
jgi:hypothetical protein